VLGREFVEGDEVVPVAIERRGRGVLGLLVQPERELVAGGISGNAGRGEVEGPEAGAEPAPEAALEPIPGAAGRRQIKAG
jgi:hypothetical protein